MLAKMILVAALGLGAAAAHAAGTAGPGAVANFSVSVHGSYDLRWALKENADCGDGTAASLDARGFATITYRTPRPLRVHTLWETIKFHGKGYPYLVLEDRWHGFKTSTDPRRSNIKFQMDIPATFDRGISGTSAHCGEGAQTISQAGCGKRSVPQFVVALSHQLTSHRIGYQALTRFGDPYHGTCRAEGDPALKQDPPLMVTDLSGDLACPPIPHFFTVRIGTTLTCKEIPAADQIVGGTARQTETVTFRRIR